MDNQEILDTLLDAQEKLFEAIEILDNYVRETNDQNAQVYLVDHLKIMASDNHGFMSKDLNLDELMERVQEKMNNE